MVKLKLFFCVIAHCSWEDSLVSCTAEVSIQFYLYIAKLHQQSPGSENVVHKKKAENNFPCKNKSNYPINIFCFTYYYSFFLVLLHQWQSVYRYLQDHNFTVKLCVFREEFITIFLFSKKRQKNSQGNSTPCNMWLWHNFPKFALLFFSHSAFTTFTHFCNAKVAQHVRQVVPKAWTCHS